MVVGIVFISVVGVCRVSGVGRVVLLLKKWQE